VKEEKDSITPMKNIMKPLLKQGESRFFEPLESRGIFCDGFSIPSYPFKTLSEAQSFLETHGVNVNMPIGSIKEG
jgi:hypothetical protein